MGRPCQLLNTSSFTFPLSPPPLHLILIILVISCMCGKSPPFSWRKTTTTGSNNKKQDGEFQSRISSRPAPTPPLYGLCVIFTSGCNKHTKTNKKVTQGRPHYLFLNGFRRASCCCCCDSFGFRALQINTLAVGPVKEH